MKFQLQSRRFLRWSAALFLCMTALPVFAGNHRSDAWASAHYDAAEKLRAALSERNGHPTRQDYQRVLDAYRRVYYGAPASGKADPSVSAVAELLVEMGHRFDDDALLRKAIRQYEFLRHEYPGSASRFEALLAIGKIYKDDLDETAHATAVFQEFLKRYPHHHLAEEARGELNELEQDASDSRHQRQDANASKLPDADANEGSTKIAATGASAATDLAEVTGIRHWDTGECTRVAIGLQKAVRFDSQRIDHPDRIFVDLLDTELPSSLAGKSLDGDDGLLSKIRIAEFQPGRTRVVLEVQDVDSYKVSMSSDPPQLVIDVYGTRSVETASKAAAKNAVVAPDEEDDSVSGRTVSTARTGMRSVVKPASERTKLPTIRKVHEARPTADGDRSLIRALGLKIGKIVIDPGHGGHDTGTIGPHGLTEKDLVLSVSLRLGKLLETRLGAQVDYTRDNDTFIPLETRTAIANQDQADLFISIHANASPDPDARGVETYYLNFTSSRDALEVAARENAVSDQSIYELQDLVKKIALKDKIEESREFATDVQTALYGGLSARNAGLRDRGVKRAPFIVLIGANMPSILAEISFVSNPGDERKLRSSEYRQRIAESLYQGIAKYVSGLSGLKVASKVDKTAGQ